MKNKLYSLLNNVRNFIGLCIFVPIIFFVGFCELVEQRKILREKGDFK